MEPKERLALSPSGLGLLERCGEAYRRRYLEGERIPPGVAAATGTAVHEAAALDLTAKAETGSLLEEGAVKEAAHEKILSTFEDGVLLSEEQEWQGRDVVMGGASDRAVSMATLHHAELAPLLSPQRGRIEWAWRVKTGFPFDLRGVIDLVEDVGGDIRVRDLKTSSRAPAKDSADVLEQLTFYHMAVRELDKVEPSAVALDFLVHRKKSSEVITLWSKRDQSDIDVLSARLERASMVLESGAYMPVNQKDSWLCNPKFCGYATTCPFYNGRTTVQVPKETE